MPPETHFYGQVTQKALIEREGKFLFLKYPENHPQAAGYWDIPGGRLNEGEKPLEGLEREVREEIGAEITIGNILATGTFTNLSGKKNFLVVYSATLVNSEAELVFDPEETSGGEWLTHEEVMELPIFYPEHQEIVRSLFREGKI